MTLNKSYRRKRPTNPDYRHRYELEQLAGFVPDRPFDKDEYECVIADYYGSGLEFRCCLIKSSGNPCRTRHDWGYVVRLKDQSLSIVGNECVVQELDSDHQIHQDIHRHRRDREHRERLESIQNDASQAQSRIEDMELYLEELDAISSFLNQFRECFGSRVYKDLADRAKIGRGEITATGIISRPYWDQDAQEERTETRKRPHRVARLQGLEIFSGEPGNLRDRIQATMKFYRDFSIDQIPFEAPDRYIANIKARFDEYAPYLREVEALTRSLERFKQNNLRTLAFLSNANKDRVNALCAHYKWIGKSISSENAKEELRNFDATLTRQLGVDYVQYGS